MLRSFTRTRRLLAFALEMLLLQVSILGGGMACASGGAGPTVEPAAAHAAHAAHAMLGAAHDASGGRHHAAPSDESFGERGVPASPHPHGASQCLAAGGCSALAVASPTPLLAVVTDASASIVVSDETLRRSARPAPEPPPPRS